MMLLEMRRKLEEAHTHQLNLLRLYGIAADALRRGREDQAPAPKVLTDANRDFARVLDEMGKVGGRLSRHYGVSAQEVQAAFAAGYGQNDT